MALHRKIKGEGAGTPITIWVSEETRDALDALAKQRQVKRSTVARQIIEQAFSSSKRPNY